MVTRASTSNPRRRAINKSHDLFTHQAVIAIICVGEFVQSKVVTCEAECREAIKAARVFVNNCILQEEH